MFSIGLGAALATVIQFFGGTEPDREHQTEATAAGLTPVFMITVSGTGGGKDGGRDKMLSLVFPGPTVIGQMSATAGEQ
jgi:hypothetical protein